MACKQEEEKRDNYEQVFRQMIGQCMADTEMLWGDPGFFGSGAFINECEARQQI